MLNLMYYRDVWAMHESVDAEFLKLHWNSVETPTVESISNNQSFLQMASVAAGPRFNQAGVMLIILV